MHVLLKASSGGWLNIRAKSIATLPTPWIRMVCGRAGRGILYSWSVAPLYLEDGFGRVEIYHFTSWLAVKTPFIFGCEEGSSMSLSSAAPLAHIRQE